MVEERREVMYCIAAEPSYLYILHNAHRPCLVVLGAIRAHMT